MMAEISVDMDRALPVYQPDDGRSWWATTGDGSNRCVRMRYFQEHSPAADELLGNPRHARIGALTDDGHVARTRVHGENAIEALVKPLDVVSGISDLPWHKDCSLGRHSYDCCAMTTGISVTGADELSGQLAVVAGSHRANVQPNFIHPYLDLPIVPLPTRTGDVTVHLSCTLHMSYAPVERERRVMYTGFSLPGERGNTIGRRLGFGARERPPQCEPDAGRPPARGALEDGCVNRPDRREMINAEVVHAAEAGLGEGCVWSPVENLLIWVDINGQSVHRFDHSTGQPVGVWHYPGHGRKRRPPRRRRAGARSGPLGGAHRPGRRHRDHDRTARRASVEPDQRRCRRPPGPIVPGNAERHRTRCAGGLAVPGGRRRHGPGGCSPT